MRRIYMSLSHPSRKQSEDTELKVLKTVAEGNTPHGTRKPVLKSFAARCERFRSGQLNFRFIIISKWTCSCKMWLVEMREKHERRTGPSYPNRQKQPSCFHRPDTKRTSKQAFVHTSYHKRGHNENRKRHELPATAASMHAHSPIENSTENTTL